MPEGEASWVAFAGTVGAAWASPEGAALAKPGQPRRQPPCCMLPGWQRACSRPHRRSRACPHPPVGPRGGRRERQPHPGQ
eukprot:5899673-Prorocentrum_lima.AAC.1